MAHKKRTTNHTIDPLMSKATAIWLLENTKLTGDQVARSCRLHILELKMLQNDVLQGENPLLNGQLSEEEISRCEADPKATLNFKDPLEGLKPFQKKERKYTPIAYRADRPKAILWLTKNYPDLKSEQIVRLLATTPKTIQAVKEGLHPLSSELQPHNPVLLGLCTESQLKAVLDALEESKSKEVGAAKAEGTVESKPDEGDD